MLNVVLMITSLLTPLKRAPLAPIRLASSSSRRSAIAMALDDMGKVSPHLQPPPEAPTIPRPNGLLVVHKPQNWTSFDVVGRVRGVLEKHLKSHGHKFGRRSRLKVGHGGTLDPMATGLLILGVGDGTKTMAEYLSGPKAYVARAQLGAETDTQDAEGVETKAAPFEHVTLEQLEAAAAGLTGDILQRPPIYSALRKDGKRLYELARKGEIKPEEVEKRPVTVHRLAVSGLDATTGEFDLEVRCSGGTYVRTLIEDIGREVGSAAHMTALERTRHGPFCSEAEAALAKANGDVGAARYVLPVVEAEFANPARLMEAVDEAGSALGEVRDVKR